MRILFLGNNWVGWQVLKWLKSEEENIVGLVLHPENRRKYSKEMIECSKLKPTHIFDNSCLRKRNVQEQIKALKPDIGISVFFGYILKQEFLSIFPAGCVNLHPSFLPFNRGANPNIWSIIDGTPAGATLHYIDESIDTGDILAQKETITNDTDTGASLYRKLELTCVDLFKEAWPLLKSGQLERKPQVSGSGTFHKTEELKKLDEIHLDSKYSAKDLINILRARTFPPYKGAYFQVGDKKVFMRLQLFYEEDLEKDVDHLDRST